MYNVLEITKKSYIKRVIGLPGEHVQIKDGAVYIDENKLQEDYLQDTVVTNDLEGLYIDVIVPANTFIATALAVSYIGANVVLVDADKDTYGINVSKISDAITDNTKAIIPVHLYGKSCNIFFIT